MNLLIYSYVWACLLSFEQYCQNCEHAVEECIYYLQV